MWAGKTPRKRKNAPPNRKKPTFQWRRSDSNRRPSRCKRDALPTELRPPAWPCKRIASVARYMFVVGVPRLELGTSALSGLRSNQLSYTPGTAKNPLKRARGGEHAILNRPLCVSNRCSLGGRKNSYSSR